MVLKSKIIFFSITAVIALSLISCEKNKNDVIPDVWVDFSMDLVNDIEFSDLAAIGNHVIITYHTNNWGAKSAGFDSSGIIVYRSLMEEFNAYDRTCPHDYAVNGLRVKVNVDFTIAICPKCSTNYALSSFGTPISGPGRYPLKNYKTSFSGQYLRVWNSF
jgi:nitrite reductase/ring-hydroxylating ferredoxin subunit